MLPKLNESFVEEEIQHRRSWDSSAVFVLSLSPSTWSWLWELLSPGILRVAVVDILRYSIIFKEVRKLALEVWSESLHQARPWEGIGDHEVANLGGGGKTPACACFNNFHQRLFLLFLRPSRPFNLKVVNESRPLPKSPLMFKPVT